MRSPVWNIFGTACWCLTFGLDILQPNPQIWSEEEGHRLPHWSEKIWPSLEHFHVYAGRKTPEESPGAWIQ